MRHALRKICLLLCESNQQQEEKIHDLNFVFRKDINCKWVEHYLVANKCEFKKTVQFVNCESDMIPFVHLSIR